MTGNLSFQVVLSAPMEASITTLTAALKEEGFGVLTRIDTHKIFKEKLGETTSPFIILGVCNPVLAHKALSANPQVGLFLPCKITVEEVSDGTLISILDPEVILGGSFFEDSEDIVEFGADARERLLRVVETLRG